MNFKFKYLAIVLGLVVISCGGDDDGSPSGGGGTDFGQNPTAEYTATLTTSFSEMAFPEEYPNNPSFGTVVAIIHAPELTVFQNGQLASEGVASYAASGDVDGLASFISASLGEENEGQFIIQTEGSANAVGEKTFTLTFTPERTRVTFLAKLNPGPDWFIGASSLDIVDGNDLRDDVEMDLSLLDAGVRAGSTYSSSSDPESNTISVSSDVPYANGAPLSGAIGNFKIVRN